MDWNALDDGRLGMWRVRVNKRRYSGTGKPKVHNRPIKKKNYGQKPRLDRSTLKKAERKGKRERKKREETLEILTGICFVDFCSISCAVVVYGEIRSEKFPFFLYFFFMFRHDVENGIDGRRH